MRQLAKWVDAKEADVEGKMAICLALSAERTSEEQAELTRLLARAGEERLWVLAAQEGVQGHVAHALGGAELPERWHQAHDTTKARIGAYMEAVDQIAAALEAGGIPVVALKNAGITRALFTCAGCSPMGDVDLLVRKSDMLPAHRILEGLGLQMDVRCPLESLDLEEALKGGGAEYQMDLPGGMGSLWVELQWRAVSGRWIRPDQEPPSDVLMSRSVPVAGSAVRLLAPEDNLLQVCLHTAKHTFVRAPGLRLHTDVDRIVRAQELDWQAFVGLTQKMQVRTAVFFSLVMARELLGTPVPLDVLDKLTPGSLKVRLMRRWLRRAGLFNPKARKFGRVGYVLFVALLYDDFRGLMRSVFPEEAWMRQRYGFTHRWMLPVAHVRRLFDLAWRRVGV